MRGKFPNKSVFNSQVHELMNTIRQIVKYTCEVSWDSDCVFVLPSIDYQYNSCIPVNSVRSNKQLRDRSLFQTRRLALGKS